MMKPYERYKHSGVEWIGDIPEHWEVRKLKYVGESIIGITYSPDDVLADETGILVLRSSNIQNGILEFDDCVYVEKEIKSKHLTKSGDILICARNGSAQLVGKSAFIDETSSGLTFGAFMTIFRSQSGRFLYYFFNSQIFKSQTGLFSTSTINQLTSDTLNNLFIAFPTDNDEQTAIANYLDEKTAQLDKLVKGKRRLIELLKEERSGVINKAVTRGINPHAKLKHSGIDWLGEIPEHWRVITLARIAHSLQTGPFGSQLHAHDYITGGIPVINPSHLGALKITAEESCAVTSETWERLKQHALGVNDVVIARRGEMGRCALVSESEKGWLCGTGSLRIRPNTQIIDAMFLTILLSTNGVKSYLSLMSVGSTMENLNATILSKVPLPFPPIEEQKQIVQFIEAETSKIDATVAKIEKEIEHLREYRTALISEVVTGKIDVRS